MTLPAVKAKLLEGKKGLIVGIANDRSIAWGCARAFRAFGAELAITYLNEKAKPHVEPLAREVEAPIFMPMDVMADGQLEAVFERIAAGLGRARLRRPLDRLLAQGRARRPRHRRAARGLPGHDGRLVLVLPPHGAPRRAADEERRHALHHDLLRQPRRWWRTTTSWASPRPRSSARSATSPPSSGPKGIRVHAISPGPLATRAASGIPEFDALLEKAKVKAPARASSTSTTSARACAFLAHDAARLITGQVALHRWRLPHHRLSAYDAARSARARGAGARRPQRRRPLLARRNP